MNDTETDICADTFAIVAAEEEMRGVEADEGNNVYFNIGLIVGFLFIFMVGICGNTIVIFHSLAPTISKSVSTMNTYIFHLGMADALYIFASLFFTVTNFNRQGWIFGNVGCKVIPAIDIVTMHVSVYVLGIMSLERYLALIRPMVINRYRNWFYARSLCIILWLSGLILAVPSMKSMKLEKIEGTGGESCTWSYGYDSHRSYIILVFWITFAIPSLLMIFIYCSVSFHFLKVTPKGRSSPRISQSKRGVILIVLLIVGVYWVCFTPFWTYQMLLVHDHCNRFDRRNIMGLITLILSYLNSCVNPFLYTLLPRKYNVWRKSRRDRSSRRTVSIQMHHQDYQYHRQPEIR